MVNKVTRRELLEVLPEASAGSHRGFRTASLQIPQHSAGKRGAGNDGGEKPQPTPYLLKNTYISTSIEFHLPS